MKTMISVLRTAKFWIFFGVVFALKLSYLYIFGPTYGPETEGFLSGLGVLHPPLYVLFLKGVSGLFPSVYFICIVQVFLYSFSMAWMVSAIFKSERLFYMLLLPAALDPNSAALTVHLGSASLFLTSVFLFLAFSHVYIKEHKYDALAGVIVTSGLAYLTQYKGLLVLMVFLLYMNTFRQHRKTFWKTALITVIGFQAILLPFRILNYFEFGTLRINAFMGMSLWNNVSVTYCKSGVRANPLTPFEEYIAYKSCQDYTPENAVTGFQLADPHSTLNTFRERSRIRPSELPEFSDGLFRTALKVIIEHPYDYLRNFVGPNLAKIFRTDEIEETASDSPSGKILSARFGYTHRSYLYFNRYYMWLCAGLMLMNLMFQLYFHNSLGMISLFNIVYLACVSFMEPVELKDLLELTPLISVNVLFLWDKLFNRNTYFRYAYLGI